MSKLVPFALSCCLACGPSSEGVTGPDARPVLVEVLPAQIAVEVLAPGTCVGRTAGRPHAASAAGLVFGNFLNKAGQLTGCVWDAPGTPGYAPFAGYVGMSTNAAGDVVGTTSADARGVWLRSDGHWTHAAALGGQVEIQGVNDAGELVGWVPGPQRAAYWSGPGVVPEILPPPGVAGTLTSYRARAVNGAGEIAGDVTETVGSGKQARLVSHGVVWRRGPEGWTVVPLPDLSAAGNQPTGINDAGWVVGYPVNGPGVALWQPTGGAYVGSLIDSNFPNGALPRIDNCGRVTGTRTGSTTAAYVWEGGSVTLLPIPAGFLSTYASDIAVDAQTVLGIVVGTATKKGNTQAQAAVRWTLPSCVPIAVASAARQTRRVAFRGANR